MAKKAKNPGPLCFPRRAFLKLRDPAKRGVEGRYSRANPQTVLDEVRNFCSRGKCHPVSGPERPKCSDFLPTIQYRLPSLGSASCL
jgi:hypothetical protein